MSPLVTRLYFVFIKQLVFLSLFFLVVFDRVGAGPHADTCARNPKTPKIWSTVFSEPAILNYLIFGQRSPACCPTLLTSFPFPSTDGYYFLVT